jgi:hypothetical protein
MEAPVGREGGVLRGFVAGRNVRSLASLGWAEVLKASKTRPPDL